MTNSVADLQKTFYGSSTSFVDSVYDQGAETNPDALTTIASVTIPEDGAYSVWGAGRYGGTADTSDNMGIYLNDVLWAVLPVVATTNSAPIEVRVTLNLEADDVLAIKNIDAGGALTSYRGYVNATKIGA